MHTFASLTTAPTVHSSLVTIVYSIMAMQYYNIYKKVNVSKENISSIWKKCSFTFIGSQFIYLSLDNNRPYRLISIPHLSYKDGMLPYHHHTISH